jgi:hypothetical protein
MTRKASKAHFSELAGLHSRGFELLVFNVSALKLKYDSDALFSSFQLVETWI